MHRHRTILFTGGLMVSLGFGIPAMAEDVNGWLANQAARVSEGFVDGSLTADESARLERERVAICREE